MKIKLLLAIILLFAISCKQNNKPQGNVPQAQTKDTLNNVSIQSKPPEQTVVTPRFLALIRHIDSLGYTFDTVRCKPSKEDIVHRVGGYVFMEIPKESTVPIRIYYMTKYENEERAKGHNDDDELPLFCEDIGNFSIEPIEKVQRVVQYYFKQKKPDIINGEKWYTDGFIEEWTFESEQQAQAAIKELMKATLCTMYFNTCAFVCSTDKQMYIYFSRAAGFMYTQKKFFNWFVKQNNITLSTKSDWYK